MNVRLDTKESGLLTQTVIEQIDGDTMEQFNEK